MDNWLAIGADESITILTGKAELGQGFRTIQYQLVSEELSVPMSRINEAFERLEAGKARYRIVLDVDF